MSHFTQRKERDCLNCGTIVEGRYCHRCGQENIQAKDSFLGLLTHFVYDITHFDSKFFSTLRYLLFKPGFLSLEYMKGKRARYLHPIRMYVFTSAVFFIIFFTLYQTDSIITDNIAKLEERKEKLLLAKSDLQNLSVIEKDSIVLRSNQSAITSVDKELAGIDSVLKTKGSNGDENQRIKETIVDSLRQKGIVIDDLDDIKISNPNFKLRVNADTSGIKDDFFGLNYKTVIGYQKMQEALPKKNRDNWMVRSFRLQILGAIEDMQLGGGRQFINAFVNNLIHNFPKLLFVSLPLFALILQLLYVGKRKLYYVDHAIFSIHLYCATFIFLLLWFGLLHLHEITHWGIINFIALVSILLIYFYEYKCLRRFYGESRPITILKFFLLNLLSFIMIIFLLAIFTIFSAMTYSGSH